MVRYPPLVLNFTQTHLCDTPFCNVSRDNCAIPHKNKHERVLRYYRLQVSRDMKSIAAGPLRALVPITDSFGPPLKIYLTLPLCQFALVNTGKRP